MSTRYDAATKIVSESQHAEVEGVILDLYTASALVAVYDRLSPEQREKFDTIPFGRLVQFCYRQVV